MKTIRQPTDAEEGVERKSFILEIKDETKGEVEAVFSTFGVKDHDGDWTLPGAFDTETEVLIGHWGHQTVWGEPPVGKGMIKETEKDARLIGNYFLDTIEGREQFTTAKNVGKKQQWSYSYNVLATGEITEKLRQLGVRRVIAKAEVFEISPVMRGAGIGTRTVAAKAADALSSPDAAAELPTPVPEPTAEEVAAKAAAAHAAEEAEARALAEKTTADDAARAAATRVADEMKTRTIAAVDEFHRVQRTLKRLGVA